MFTNYDPIVLLMIQFLKLLNIKMPHVKIQDDLESHPDWPSLLSLSDSLHKWTIPNSAGQIMKDEIEDIPKPFLATLPGIEHEIVIVTSITSDKVTYYTHVPKYRKIVQLKNEFLERWGGVVLIAEPAHSSLYSKKKKARLKEIIREWSIWATFIIAYILINYFFLININQSLNELKISALHSFLLLNIQLIGFIITSILLWFEVDKFNPSLQKICSGNSKKINCNAVLTSKGSKIFNWLSWSEIGFFYFSGSLLNLIFPITSITEVIAFTSLLNVFALPYTFFSIYYQWRIAKNFCILCLIVQGLLLAGFINVCTSPMLSGITFQSINILKIIGLYFFPISIWVILKPKISKLIKSRNKIREFNKLKYNQVVFNGLLESEKHYTEIDPSLGLIIGNPAAKHQIVKVCSPYCGPCSNAHKVLHEMLESSLDIQVRIIFKVSNRKEDLPGTIARHLLSVAANGDHSITRNALNDWYMNNEKNYDQFKVKYPIKQSDDFLSILMDKMNKWCDVNEISYTPTIFLNGRKLPQLYNAEDLKYFLSE